MEKIELKEKILKAVGLNEELMDRVFDSFVKKIETVLQVNQTIRIEEIGFFQLRVEPVSRLERDSAKKSKSILIFKNIESQAQRFEGNPFMTIEIESEDIEPSNFSESVFNLSIDKPSTIFSEAENDELSNSDTQLEEKIQESLTQLIASGIILDGYELLNKETVQQNEQFDDDDHLTSELFEEKNNKELEDLISHPDENSEENKLEESKEEIIEETSKDGIDEYKFEDSSEQVVEDDKADEIINEPQFSNPFDELNDLINKDKEPQVEENINNQAIIDEKRSSVQPEERGSKRLMFLAFAAIFVILLISIIYFTSAPSDRTPQMETYVNEKVDVNNEEPIQPVTKIDTSAILETSSDDKLLKEESPEIVKQEADLPKSKASYTGLYRRIEKDISITDRIYFDGLKYSVQISSWKSKTIAEHEVKKLKKLGFDAFIFRLFIKSKDDTYNRVRIGYFDSKNEAANFLKHNKL